MLKRYRRFRQRRAWDIARRRVLTAVVSGGTPANIDTAEKRRSVAGLPFFPFGPAVTPNAAKDVEWRQQAGWGYSGIAPS